MILTDNVAAFSSALKLRSRLFVELSSFRLIDCVRRFLTSSSSCFEQESVPFERLVCVVRFLSTYCGKLGDDDDDNDMVSIECKQLKLSSPREGFQHDDNKIQPQPQNTNLIQVSTTVCGVSVCYMPSPMISCCWPTRGMQYVRCEKYVMNSQLNLV